MILRARFRNQQHEPQPNGLNPPRDSSVHKVSPVSGKIVLFAVLLMLIVILWRLSKEQSSFNVIAHRYPANNSLLLKDCSFCVGASGNHFHQTAMLFRALVTRTECLRGQSNVSMTFPGQSYVSLNIQDIFRGQFSRHNESTECEGSRDVGRFPEMTQKMNNSHALGQMLVKTMSKFKMINQFVRIQLGLTSHITEQLELNPLRKQRVVIIERNDRKRKFRNASELKMIIEAHDPSRTVEFQVDVIDFQGMSVRNQVETLIQPSPVFIIMAHGSALTNLMYLDEFTASNVNIIEICPPYTHCVCQRGGTDICPWFFYLHTSFLNMSYYGYAVEDTHLDCDDFCAGKPGARRGPVRDMSHVTVLPQSLLQMMHSILESPNLPKKIDVNNQKRIKIHKMEFTNDIRQQFANLSNAKGAIQPRDMK